MILAEDKIQVAIENWRERLQGKTPDEAADEIESIFQKADTQRKRHESITQQQLYENLVVYPFPERTELEEDPRPGPLFHGVLCELTLGSGVFLTSDEFPRMLANPESNPYLVVKPGDFALLTTDEVIYLPRQVMGFISIRNRFKQGGLINISGFHVDPGFRGRLVFTVYNACPRDILLKYRERMFLITFAEVLGDAQPYWKMQRGLPLSVVASLHGESVSPRSLDKRLNRVETIIKLVLAPIVAGLIGVLIKLVFG